MIGESSQLPLGFYVRAAFVGPKCVVGGLGEMSGLAIVERDSGEPLQYLPVGAPIMSVLERWESAFGAWEKARDER